MAYERQTWQNSPSTATPISADRLNHIEEGIEAAAETADSIPAGPEGPQGPQGDPGPEGPEGAQGIQGPQGDPGASGADGPSAYDVAVADGFVGDETAWLASLVGPQGDPGAAGAQGPQGDPGADGAQGPQGEQGPQGIQGVQGNPGADGADGASVLNGAGAPGAPDGADGDFWIDTSADEIYGPKTTGAWGSATSLVGPVGPQGAAGVGGVKAFASDSITANWSPSSTSYSDSGLEVTIDADAGDLVLLGGSWAWYEHAPQALMDVQTIVGGSPVNYASGLTATDSGFWAWWGPASSMAPGGAPQPYIVQAGDISGGQVTFRLVAKGSDAGTKVLMANAVQPSVFYAMNCGPVGG